MRVKRARGRIAPKEGEGVGGGLHTTKILALAAVIINMQLHWKQCTLTPCNTS